MKHVTRAHVSMVMAIGCATAALAGDLVVDGAVATTGGWYEFADGSTQNSAAYPRWQQIAIVDWAGRGDFTDPVAAMDALSSWCGTPTLSNPCLVKILPGWYDIGTASVAMQSYVDIEGSGRNVTFIRAASGAAVVYGASNAELRSLTVINYGDGGYPQGIAIESAVNFPRMTDVFVIVEGANTKNTGVVITDSRAMIDSMRVWTSDGAEALGISIANSTGELRNVEVVTYRVSDVIATGIEYTDGSRALLRDSRVIVQDADLGLGIVATSANPQVDGVTVLVTEVDGTGIGFLGDNAVAALSRSSFQVASSGYATGVQIANLGEAHLSDVNINAQGLATGDIHGIYSMDGSEVSLEHVGISATGGSMTWAIRNRDLGDITLFDVTAEAFAAADSNHGVENHSGGELTATNLIVKAFGGTGFNYGVLNRGGAVLTATGATAEVTGGTGGYAILNADDGGPVRFDRSSISGTSSSVRNDNSGADFFVGASKLVGPVSADLTCFGNYDETYTAVTCP